MKKPFVSFVIPVFNAETTIENCIKSVIAQRCKKEIIIVDDGSTDSTPMIYSKYPVNVIRIPNSGAAVARNKGIQVARGDFIALVDSDVFLSSDWVTNVLKNDFSKWDYVMTPSTIPKDAYLEMVKNFKKDPQISFDKIVIFGNGAIFRNKLQSQTTFDEQFIVGGEDWDLMIRLLKHPFRIKLDSNSTYEHRHVFRSQTKRVWTFIKKRVLFGYGDFYCFVKHRDVKQISHFLVRNWWVGFIFPFIYLNVKLKRIMDKSRIENVMKEFNDKKRIIL